MFAGRPGVKRGGQALGAPAVPVPISCSQHPGTIITYSWLTPVSAKLAGKLRKQCKERKRNQRASFLRGSLRYNIQHLWGLAKSLVKWISYPHLAEL